MRSIKIISEEIDSVQSRFESDYRELERLYAHAKDRKFDPSEQRQWDFLESQCRLHKQHRNDLRAELEQTQDNQRRIAMSSYNPSFSVTSSARVQAPQLTLPVNGILPGDEKQRYSPYHRVGKLFAFADEQTAFDSGMWMKAVAARLSGAVDNRAESYCNQIGLEITNASYEGSGPAGGYTTPAPLAATIIAVREKVGVARQVCRVIPTNSDSLSVPKRNGGCTVYYPNENQALTDSDPTWRLISCALKKRACLSYLSQELAEDSIINIVDYLVTEMGYALALQEDNELINGTGASTYGNVTGLLSSIGSAGVSTAATGHDTWPELDIADMVACTGKLPERFHNYNPSWICSHAFFVQVMARIAFNAGGTTMAEVISGTPTTRTFLGYRVYLTSQMPTATGVSQKSALFGAFDQAVLLADRGSIRVQRSDDIKFIEDQIALKAVSRYDMQVHDPGDASNAGAYVVLSTAS